MTTRRPFTFIAAAIFLLMALAHLYRLLAPFPVTIGATELPQWVSIVALAITAGLSAILFRESRR